MRLSRSWYEIIRNMSLRMRRPALATVVLILLASSTLFAKSPQTTITVKVTDQKNKPLSGASVILDFLGSRQITKLGRHKKMNWEEHTNLQGIARFPPVPQGTVQIQVIDQHYQTFGKLFDVNEAEKTINIQLKPPQRQYTVNPGPDGK